ncbi:hypothetical protein WN55_03068 [Dufourea novaeangliae]|uniref:Uncharacterized protein n=1 Tax=Dufourea novaeangliae TaxID=178035 RepID=A0A154PI40_DUFNO|nr:hypothetical protein WN55_03068 [Dufourea novaeangliae]
MFAGPGKPGTSSSLVTLDTSHVASRFRYTFSLVNTRQKRMNNHASDSPRSPITETSPTCRPVTTDWPDPTVHRKPPGILP